MHHPHSSKESELVRLFALRSASPDATPEAAMAGLIARLRRRLKIRGTSFEPYLAARNISHIELIIDAEYDGLLEPQGNTFQDGFIIKVCKSKAESRTRFTIAHELCHTFFYEFVPEIKFSPHPKDQQEERLCNFGAAEILMPTSLVRKSLRAVAPSLHALDLLAKSFSVSLEAMLLRLRTLHLWDCEIATWHRDSSGKFLLDRLLNGKPRDWQWTDDSLLKEAWFRKKEIRGRTWIQYFGPDGTMYVRPVWYNITYRGNSLVSLWSRKPMKWHRSEAPLFGKN